MHCPRRRPRDIMGLQTRVERVMARRDPMHLASLVFVAVAASAACSDSPTQARPRVPARLEIMGGDGQNGAVGALLPNPLVVKVVDADGRPVRDHAVTFHVTGGAGSMLTGAVQTDADGVAEDRWTLGTATGEAQRAEARVVRTGTSAPLTVSFVATPQAGPAASIEVVSGRGQTAHAGSP